MVVAETVSTRLWGLGLRAGGRMCPNAYNKTYVCTYIYIYVMYICIYLYIHIIYRHRERERKKES